MTTIKPAINVIPLRIIRELKIAKLALLTNSAAKAIDGSTTDIFLSKNLGLKLSALFAPEHGYSGTLSAGKEFRSAKHPRLNIPIHSLYGINKRPTPLMLKNIDIVLIDIQMLPARPYTYCSTIAMMIEECSRLNIKVIILDRIVPCSTVIDGPNLDSRFSSFVSYIPSPMAFGMTPGELGLYIAAIRKIKLDLSIVKIQGFDRTDYRASEFFKPWVSPSPAITCYEAAVTYLATVFSESFPSMFETRKSGMPFRSFGADWMDARSVADSLNKVGIKGASFTPFRFPRTDRLNCVKINVTDDRIFLPASTSIYILAAMANEYGADMLWEHPAFNMDHFDRLYGTDMVRNELKHGTNPDKLLLQMKSGIRSFVLQRNKHLLY